MNLINLGPTSRLGLNGEKPEQIKGSTKQSTLHNTSSINNEPQIQRPVSRLDLDGVTPTKYINTVRK